MKEELMKLLRPVTSEEEEILKGNSQIKKQIYTDKKDFTIVSEKMLARGRLMDIRTHTRFVEFPKHKHDYIEIIYMCSGQTVHLVNDSTRIVLEQGDLLFLNQHAFHAIEPAGENDIAINFMILPEFFDVAFTMLEGENELRNFIIGSLMQDTGKSDYLHFKVADVLPVQNLVENMIWSLLIQQGHGRKINQTTMGLLFLHLMNYTEKIAQHNEAQKDSMTVMTALRYIEDNYRMASLTELAGELNLSVYHLSRLVKQQTGSTFKELLQRKRLNKAVQLLTETKLSISDIIGYVGYDNASYFFRIFKERYGISPREYRSRAGSNLNSNNTGNNSNSNNIGN